MDENQVEEQLKQAGVLIVRGHSAVCLRRREGATVNKKMLYPHTALLSSLCRELAERVALDGSDVVVAPSGNCSIMAHLMATGLSGLTNRDVLAVFADRTLGGDAFYFNSEYARILAGRKVLVVGDVIMTGRMTERVVAAVEREGGHVIGVAVICDSKRGPIEGVSKRVALLTLTSDAPSDGSCQLCAAGVPIDKG